MPDGAPPDGEARDAGGARAGMVLLDKAAGVSSFGAIARLRRVLGRRVGHAGTLDPFATGLMLVLAGRATRLQTYLVGLDKRYRATIQLGVRSTTGDPEGDLVPDAWRTDEAAIRTLLPAFTGAIEQVPPAASAVHIDGERAYKRHRRGEEVVMPTRQVRIHSLVLLSFDEAAQSAVVDVHCGSGTYIRALARDMGELLGTGGYCRELRRTAIGTFDLDDAADEAAVLAAPFAAPHWREPAAVLGHLPVVHIGAETAAALRHGRSVPAPPQTPAADDPFTLVDDAGALVGVGRRDGDAIRTRLVLGER